MARLILDTGAIIGFLRGDVRVAAALQTAWERGDEIVVSPVVVAQVLRGGYRDAPVHRLLGSVWVPFAGLHLARAAGYLLGAAGMSDVADALIVAEALRAGPSIILTSDPNDMRRLAGSISSIRIIAI